MSILIKGIEMPKAGYIDVRIFPDGIASKAIGEKPYYKEFHVVEVKAPHGRLIDAKAFETKNKYFWHRDFINAKYEDALCDLFDEAPTVLEAEGKDDG